MSKRSKTKLQDTVSVIIPEREAILACLQESGRPLSRKQLSDYFNIRDPEIKRILGRRLKAMLRDGQLIKNRRGSYGLIEKMDLIRGRVIGHPDGYGFVVPDEGGKDLFLSAREMRSVLHDDRVLVRQVSVDANGKRSGALVEVLEHANQQIVGRYFEDSGIMFVVPDNKRISQDVLINPGKNNKARHGEYVVVEITHQPDKHRQPVGRITEVLGSGDGVDMSVDIAVRTYDLPFEWSDSVKQQTARFNAEIDPNETNDRVDLRELNFVTIDGADAKDFDDAVYCEKQGKGWRLLVAIADVSHYVKPGTAIDEEARLRGTSVYFPETVIPMLPEELSNGLCSLRPNEDRLSMVCELSIDHLGRVKRYQFYKATICSSARLTYGEMASIVIDKNQQKRDQRKALLTNLDDLYSLYQLLNTQRKKNGLIDFSSIECRFVFDENKHINAIEKVERNDAHRLIEEMMLVANIAAALWIEENEIPSLYRVHNTPKPEKLEALQELLKLCGLQLPGGKEPHASDYADLVDKIRQRDDAAMLETALLRSMPLAIYSAENEGHFGLGFEAYAHFTSPIRRYPDLMVHRAIEHIAEQQSIEGYPFSKQAVLELAEHCSMTERRAEEASRDVIQRLKCLFMKDKVGEDFRGIVSSVTAFGLFVVLDGNYTEGLIHISTLPADYYHFDQTSHLLKGERSKRLFKIGQQLTVRVANVDLEDKKIDFELIDDE